MALSLLVQKWQTGNFLQFQGYKITTNDLDPKGKVNGEAYPILMFNVEVF